MEKKGRSPAIRRHLRRGLRSVFQQKTHMSRDDQMDRRVVRAKEPQGIFQAQAAE